MRPSTACPAHRATPGAAPTSLRGATGAPGNPPAATGSLPTATHRTEAV